MTQYVYFVQDTHSGWVKIGTTKDVQARLRTLRTANRSELRLLALIEGDRRREQAIHQELADHRLRGEWFARDAAIGYLRGVQPDDFAFARASTPKQKPRWTGAQKRNR